VSNKCLQQKVNGREVWGELSCIWVASFITYWRFPATVILWLAIVMGLGTQGFIPGARTLASGNKAVASVAETAADVRCGQLAAFCGKLLKNRGCQITNPDCSLQPGFTISDRRTILPNGF
jgi:hypothetical protein